MLDICEFSRATNPRKTLNVENEEDRALYIDFSTVWGGEIDQDLKDSIT